MIAMQVTVDNDILEAIKDGIRQSPARMRIAYRRNVGRLKGRILAKLKVVPNAPKYPIRWKSERQRRAFFATDGFGGGIPYQRTNKLVNSYDVRMVDTAEGAIISVTNSDPKAQFVVGDWAQPFHLDTGWVQMADVISDARKEAEEILIQTWYTVVGEFAGVPK